MNIILYGLAYIGISVMIFALCGLIAACVVSILISLDEQKTVSPWYLIGLVLQDFKNE